MRRFEIVRGYDEKILNAIMEIYEGLYHGTEHQEVLDESRAFNKEVLADPDGIVVILRDNDNSIIGYALGLPQSKASQYPCILRFDPEIENDTSTFYVDTVEVKKGCAKITDFLLLITKLVDEAEKRGYFNFSMYVRSEISERMADIIRKKISDKVRIARTVKGDWYGIIEPYDLITGISINAN